ncbi:MAG TPA: UDP-glucose/GDP-mannose dehydrogenase family protein [Terriglobales bacterium]|jgi:UDPglucose 6-dehydrogenase|nr:UDP-glucose/GDP-mannose dehydrogenase family protein [Terriglobales bacterium]
MKISVIGAGYVGLTTAACLSQIGHDVFCSESDPEKLGKLKNGIMPLFEPGLEAIMKAGLASGRLRFGSTESAVDWGRAIFICVGTPPLDNGEADLSAVEGVARTIAKRASGYRLVIEKSTVPVQTGSQLRKYLSANSTSGLQYDVASNPEFLREGSAVGDLLHPDRIVVGVDSPRAEKILREIYEPIIQQKFSCPIHAQCPGKGMPVFFVTDTSSAELIKHASNSFLAMKISFINMVANLCEAVGADVTKVAEGMGLDPRIGSSFLNPGLGFGGFCFPKDVQAFIRIAEKSGCDFSLLKEVEKINQRRIQHFVNKLREELWIMRGKKIAIWGLAFKPNTDDVRFAQSIALVKSLLSEGAVLCAYDPEATEKARAIFPDLHYAADPYEAAEGADAIVIATEWEMFRNIDWNRLRNIVENPLIVDGRNIFGRDEVACQGFHYVSIGRTAARPQERKHSSLEEVELGGESSPKIETRPA